MATSQEPGTNRDPEHLERTADQIRADLDRTLDALERKLAPSQLLDRSLAYLRDHGGELTRAVGETVRSNPIPIALAVAGIGWLVAATLRNRNDVDEAYGDESPYADAHYAETSGPRSNFQEHVAATRERLRSAREQTRHTQYQVVSVIERQPLLLGGLAAALGALIGAIIPATEYEDRIVGQVRDRAVERAKQMGERQYRNLRSKLETHRDFEVSGRAH
jgi:hypothetical protein